MRRGSPQRHASRAGTDVGRAQLPGTKIPGGCDVPVAADHATKVLRKGEGGFVEAGPPMMLTSLGPDTRRALALVHHDSGQPWMTVTTEWRQTSSCPES